MFYLEYQSELVNIHYWLENQRISWEITNCFQIKNYVSKLKVRFRVWYRCFQFIITISSWLVFPTSSFQVSFISKSCFQVYCYLQNLVIKMTQKLINMNLLDDKFTCWLWLPIWPCQMLVFSFQFPYFYRTWNSGKVHQCFWHHHRWNQIERRQEVICTCLTRPGFEGRRCFDLLVLQCYLCLWRPPSRPIFHLLGRSWFLPKKHGKNTGKDHEIVLLRNWVELRHRSSFGILSNWPFLSNLALRFQIT